MTKYVSGRLAACLISSACLCGAASAVIKGRVVDPSGAPVSGAQVAVVNRVGVVARVTASPTGSFELSVPDAPDTSILVTAQGFSTRTVKPAEAATVQLEIAPQTASIEVAGSTIEVPVSLQGSSVDTITNEQLRERNEPMDSYWRVFLTAATRRPSKH